MTEFLTSVSIVSGLVLSALASAALNPLDPEDFPEQRRAAEAFNVVAALTVSCQLCVVLYSTFALYITSTNVHSANDAWRVLSHIDGLIGFLEFMTYVPALGAFALIVLAAGLRCSTEATLTIAIGTAFTFLLFQATFMLAAREGYPFTFWMWAPLVAPWYFVFSSTKARLQANAKHEGQRLPAQAKKGVLASLDGDDRGGEAHSAARGTVCGEHGGEAEELESWLKSDTLLGLDATPATGQVQPRGAGPGGTWTKPGAHDRGGAPSGRLPGLV
eukprot:7381828-Prymnesium_polylepis.2